MEKIYMNSVRLNSIGGVNRLLGRVANLLIQDEITEDRARAIGYICNILIKGLDKGDIEKRLEDLEKIVEREAG